jgi:muramoyltetrapeptide carboxypeptidase
MIIPEKLKIGDEIRVVAPARSLGIITADSRKIALEKLSALGLKVTFGKHVEENDEDFFSSPIQSRVEDLHEAFADKNIKGILTVVGGFNSNQLLRYLDYKLIKKNPKIFCGFSDITALSGAFNTKAGLVAYQGPHFSTFGIKKGGEYTIEYFKKCLFDSAPFAVEPSKEWSDDLWYKDQENRNFIPNPGWWIMQEGEAEGRTVGGNLCTFNLLQGSEYMPDLKNSILLIEDDEESLPRAFDRDLQSLIHQPGFSGVRAVLIGRFQNDSKMTRTILEKIISTKKELRGLPIIANLDFGHTEPYLTLPLGGRMKISAKNNQSEIKVLKH